jgi:hypothetical protein
MKLRLLSGVGLEKPLAQTGPEAKPANPHEG